MEFPMRPKWLSKAKPDIIIQWADALITDANSKGEIPLTSFWEANMLERLREPEEIIAFNGSRAKIIREKAVSDFQQEQDTVAASMSELKTYREKVKHHLLHEGYIRVKQIFKGADGETWLLTKRGRTVKYLGGHNEYKDLLKRKLNILRHQNTINWLLFSTAVAAIVVPFIVAIFFSPENIINVPPHSHNDSVLLHQLVEDALKQKEPTPRQVAPSRQ
jgi:hypothetical protein